MTLECCIQIDPNFWLAWFVCDKVNYSNLLPILFSLTDCLSRTAFKSDSRLTRKDILSS